MLILGFESSCDETGVALYDTELGLLSHALHSQVQMHAEYGGVVPELASRDHIRRALPLTELVLKQANVISGNALAAKVFLSGEVTKKLNLSGLLLTKGARAAIEAAGGKIAVAE